MKTILQTINVETTLEQLEPLTLAAANLKDYRYTEDEAGTITIERLSVGTDHEYGVLRAERFPVSKTRVSVRINLQELARLIYRNESAVIDAEQDTKTTRGKSAMTTLQVHTDTLPAAKFTRFGTFETLNVIARERRGSYVDLCLFMPTGSIDLARESLAGSPETTGNL